MPSRARTSRRPSAAAAPDAAAGPFATAWNAAVRLLAARERSEHEVRARLSETAPDIVDAVVERLRHFAYLDDARFARVLCEQLARRGFGSARARTEMAEHHLAHELIQEAVAGLAAHDEERARELLARRYPGRPMTAAERARAARFLQRRGFPEAVVHAVVGERPEDFNL